MSLYEHCFLHYPTRAGLISEVPARVNTHMSSRSSIPETLDLNVKKMTVLFIVTRNFTK